MSFANLKKNSGSALANLQQQVNDAENKNSGGNKDPRKFKHTYDKNTKVGSAVIRFLPWGNGDRLPWVEWQEFSFKGKGGNYWERSLRTLGQDDPVAELNHLQWERKLGGKDGDDEKAVKSRGRRFRYMYNIIVVNDPANPENNGKNFIYEAGPSIHKMIMAAMVPEHADIAPVPIFDLWQGANFHIRTKDKHGYLNYDDSSFAPAAPLHPDDTILERFYNGMIDLTEFEGDDQYKSYDELKQQLIKVLGAQYVANITGEAISVTQAAQAGGNPFVGADAGTAGQSGNGFAQQFNQQATQAGTGGEDPFANPNSSGGQSQPTQNNDPFAASAPQQSTQTDPFAAPQGDDATTNQSQAPDGEVSQFGQQPTTDPFAGATNTDNDPFAGMTL